MALSGMRGLSVFISDVRNCQNKEQERVRVDKELANIRTRFKNQRVLVKNTLLLLVDFCCLDPISGGNDEWSSYCCRCKNETQQ
jgi:hypothetical protein